MKKQTALRWGFVFLMICIPWIYLATIWNGLPQTIAVHFGINGQPDRFGDRGELFFSTGIFTFMSLLIYLILSNIYKIDPKRYKAEQSGAFLKAANAVVVFMTCTCLLVLNWTVKQQSVGLNLLLIMMGIFFAYLGNLMHSIKPNYFFGMRLPWTLESEDNWRATHLLVSKLWFAGGILICILALFVKPFPMFFILVAILLLMVIIPIVYSYRYFRKEKKSGQL